MASDPGCGPSSWTSSTRNHVIHADTPPVVRTIKSLIMSPTCLHPPFSHRYLIEYRVSAALVCICNMAPLVTLVFGFLIASASAVLPKVDVDCNQYAGVPTSTGITQWLGIRYAAPPLAALRFSPPADPPCYPGILPASSVGAREELGKTDTNGIVAWSILP